jgi:hypothetical protein
MEFYLIWYWGSLLKFVDKGYSIFFPFRPFSTVIKSKCIQFIFKNNPYNDILDAIQLSVLIDNFGRAHQLILCRWGSWVLKNKKKRCDKNLAVERKQWECKLEQSLQCVRVIFQTVREVRSACLQSND